VPLENDSGNSPQTVREYSEAQKRLLFLSDIKNRSYSIGYLAECECLQTAMGAVELVRECVQAEINRRHREREKQLAIDFQPSRSEALVDRELSL